MKKTKKSNKIRKQRKLTKTRKTRKGGFLNMFSKKVPVVPSEKCDINNILSVSNNRALLDENYSICCPKSSFGMENSSPYCKQLRLNRNALKQTECHMDNLDEFKLENLTNYDDMSKPIDIDEINEKQIKMAEIYKNCCPNSSFGMANTSQYCKTLKGMSVNMDKFKKENDTTGYQISFTDRREVAKDWGKYGGKRKYRTRKHIEHVNI